MFCKSELSNVKSYNTKMSHCANKTIAYSFHVPLHWGAILMHGCVLRNITEWLFLNLYYGEY